MLSLIPLPNHMLQSNFEICFSNYKIKVQKPYSNAIKQFKKELKNKLNVQKEAPVYQFIFKNNQKLKEQEYHLDMQEDQCIVYAKNEVGFFYATRTLAQILKLNTFEKVDKINTFLFNIQDKPRFNFRSFMLDESRHFFGKKEVKRILDLMADLKMNYFHWHLSDDQGFRIHFKEFDALKTIASKRLKTQINAIDGHDFENRIYQHCYEEEDILEIIAYAKSKYIEIIPEIDMPGHTTAIVAAYKELHCKQEQVDVETKFGIFHDILCPGKPQTYTFCKKLLTCLCNLFKDSKYIHIGGDEVKPTNWEQCPDCKKKMEELHLDNVKLLQQHFMNEMSKHLQSLNKKIICWHDGVYENSNSDIYMQYWTWEMDKQRIEYMNQGRKSIYSPCSQFYFNDPYAELPLKTTYCKKITLANLNRTGLASIKGVEGCIWTEWIDSTPQLEVLILPRLQALAEKAWTNQKHICFKDFLNRLQEHHQTLKYKKFSYMPTKLALANGKAYRHKIAKAFRGNDKKVEFKLYLKKH